MRLAAVLAGLVLNAGFLEFVYSKGGWRMDWFTLFAGPVVWGAFLVFGGLLAPARLGFGARELVERALGLWVGGVVWWVLAPVWLVNWFAAQMFWFVTPVRIWFLPDTGMDDLLLKEMVVVYWPWLVLTVLPGWSSIPMRVAAAVLVAGPIAFRDGWPEAARYVEPPICCGGVWEMQGLLIWLAPALLWCGVIPGAGQRTVWKGLLGVLLPLLTALLVTVLTFAGAAAMGPVKGFSIVAALAHIGTQHGRVRMVVVAMTVLAAGRFCVDCAGEYLGAWRRWWSVGLLTAAMMGWGAGRWPYELRWELAAAPFVPLLGVIAGAYWARRTFVFGWAEQAVAVGAWAAGCVFWELPFVGWAVGFVVAGGGVRLCEARRFSRG